MRGSLGRRRSSGHHVLAEAATQLVERLHTMWVRANDEINAAINQPTGEFALFVSDFLAVFDSPVDEANDKIHM